MLQIVGSRSGGEDQSLAASTDPVDGAELHRAAATALRSIAGARLATDFIAFGVGIALARLIPPAAFGQAAVALAVVLVASDLAGNGIAASLVRLPLLERRHREAAMCVAIVGGSTLSALLLLAAPLTSPIFGAEVVRLLQLSSPAFLIFAVGAIAQASLLRRLAFSKIAIIDIASLAIGASSALALAVSNVDAAAVVVLYLAAATASTIFYLLFEGAVWPRWDRSALAELFAFGAPTALAGVAYTVFRHVDYGILATRMSPTSVGLYWRAHGLGIDYQGRISSVVLRIAFPVYSRATNGEAATSLALRLIRLQTLLVAPVVATIIVVTPTAVPLLFGEQWRAAVAPTQILACAGVLAALTAALGPLILASGRPRTLLVFNLGAIAVYAPLIYFAASAGLTAVCYVVVAFHLVACVIQSHIASRIAGLRSRMLARAVMPGAICGVLTLLAEMSLLLALKRLDVSPTVELLVLLPVGGAAHLAAVRVLFPRSFRAVRNLASVGRAGAVLDPLG